MPIDRRGFLGASAALAACLSAHTPHLIAQHAPQLLPRSGARRVVIVGGGWGGLTAARHLRDLAPDLEVVLLEKNAVFWSGPMSNKWLVGLVETNALVHDYAAAARSYGYTFIRAEVTAVDRERRRIVTATGTLDYDWLVLAVGIRYDFSAWLGGDRSAIEHARRHYPSAYIPGSETQALKAKLDGFKGGDLLMTIPAMPYRCPPSPYERACMIGWLLKSRKIKGKLIVLDPNPIMPRFARTFAEQYRDQIVYLPQARVTAIDPFNKTVATEFETLRFDDAILMAPQQAGDLVWQAGLIGRNGDGKPSGWADLDPLHLHARGDERVFLIGDLIDKVSPLFGHYPKSGHMASRQGRIAAQEIAARARGAVPEKLLPEGVCYVATSIEPMELTRIDTRYRLRGDGLIAQTVSQTHDPNPRDEDIQWAQSMFAEFLAP